MSWQVSAALTAGLFIVLTSMVLTGATTPIDVAARSWALSHNTTDLVDAWETLSLLGSTPVLIGLVLFAIFALWLVFQRYKAKWLAAVMLAAVLLNSSLKWLVHRPRPEEIYFGTMPESYSFPSGHALHNFVFYGAIAILLVESRYSKWRWVIWVPAVVIILAIGLSRIFLGVHYLSDVIAGYLAGAALLFCAAPFLHKGAPPSFQTLN